MAYAFNDDKSKVDLLDWVYPVGSIYMSVNSTDPGTLFGGTWVAWSVGRVPVGINPSDTDFATSQKTGGAKTVTLTAKQIPSHTHKYTDSSSIFAQENKAASGTAVRIGQYNDNANATTGSTGGGQAHTNLPPYIVCYMWKRTA